MSFTNIELHAHTDASLADGAMTYKEYVDKAIEYGAPAIAITERAVSEPTANNKKNL